MGFYVRRLFVVFGLLVAALVLMAAPASAHANHDRSTASSQDAAMPAGLQHDGDADHDVDHNPTDHTHPIGEDTYHEKASHSSLDFAHHQAVVVKLGEMPRAAIRAYVAQPVRGFAPSPPIRPPLA